MFLLSQIPGVIIGLHCGYKIIVNYGRIYSAPVKCVKLKLSPYDSGYDYFSYAIAEKLN